MLFSEPKIPQFLRSKSEKLRKALVSVLFSEPKIPQFFLPRSSLMISRLVSVLFSEPKIPQFFLLLPSVTPPDAVSVLFSEPKIPQFPSPTATNTPVSGFQCSSASRKFLNSDPQRFSALLSLRFSALQRAENSSILRRTPLTWCTPSVSVLFSEPKIPQLKQIAASLRNARIVSVLFSEPKIPQFS